MSLNDVRRPEGFYGECKTNHELLLSVSEVNVQFRTLEMSSAMYAVWYWGTDVSEEPALSVFSLRESLRQPTLLKR